jgi:branched-subunit amino acid transport protein
MNHGAKKVARTEISAQMTTFLYQARIAAVRAITVDELLARHGGRRQEVEYALMIALQKRAGE